MLDNKLSALPFNRNFAYNDWKMHGTWPIYRFNYDGKPYPEKCELNLLENGYITLEQIKHVFLYMIADDATPVDREKARVIDEPVFVLNLSSSNSGHSLSEVMSFLEFYIKNELDIKILMSEQVERNIPFICQFFRQFVPDDRIIVMREKEVCFVKQAWYRRNTHYNLITNWRDIPYQQNDNIVIFENLESTLDFHIDHPRRVMQMAEKIYLENKDIYPQYDMVMLAKIAGVGGAMVTPDRAMILSDGERASLEDAGIKILSMHDFANIQQYVTTLYGAKRVITSYGSVACTNRFFVNPEAEVLLLANQHYKFEYEYAKTSGEHWSLRHSHLFPVRKQTVILDHNNEINGDDVRRIIKIVKS